MNDAEMHRVRQGFRVKEFKYDAFAKRKGFSTTWLRRLRFQE